MPTVLAVLDSDDSPVLCGGAYRWLLTPTTTQASCNRDKRGGGKGQEAAHHAPILDHIVASDIAGRSLLCAFSSYAYRCPDSFLFTSVPFPPFWLALATQTAIISVSLVFQFSDGRLYDRSLRL